MFNVYNFFGACQHKIYLKFLPGKTKEWSKEGKVVNVDHFPWNFCFLIETELNTFTWKLGRGERGVGFGFIWEKLVCFFIFELSIFLGCLMLSSRDILSYLLLIWSLLKNYAPTLYATIIFFPSHLMFLLSPSKYSIIIICLSVGLFFVLRQL